MNVRDASPDIAPADALAPGAPARPAAEAPEEELALARSRVARAIYAGLGLLAVALGAIGVVLPGWPTTVFLLVAAFFFARSSPRFYAWLLNHRLFGGFIRDVREGRGMPLGAKAFAISMIVLFAGGSGVALWERPWVSLLVWAFGAVGIAVILRQPTRRD